MKPVYRLFAIILPCALGGLAGPAAAQHAEQLELGGYASFTRYDRAFTLNNQFGGGARFGYFVSNRVSVEVDGGYSNPGSWYFTGQKATMSIGSASVVLNYPYGKRALFYVLGGYSRVVTGDTAPFDFVDNAVHGGLGGRFFLSDKVALRLEGRAIYAPKTNLPWGTWTGHVIGSAGLSYFLSQPQQRQGKPPTQYQWYWGAQGGAFISKTNLQSATYDPVIGGHWLITAKRTALYVAYDQAIFLGDDQAVIEDPNSNTGLREVTFHDMRRLMAGVMAFPLQKVIEPYAGAGFAMMEVLNPVVDCSGTTPDSQCPTLSDQTAAEDRAHDAASKAFFWVAGGLQMTYGRMSLFGQYILTSSAKGFLLDGPTHSLQGGIRYSFGTSKEDVTDQR